MCRCKMGGPFLRHGPLLRSLRYLLNRLRLTDDRDEKKEVGIAPLSTTCHPKKIGKEEKLATNEREKLIVKDVVLNRRGRRLPGKETSGRED